MVAHCEVAFEGVVQEAQKEAVMVRGDVKEAIECLDNADGVLRHRLGLNLTVGERYACEESRRLLQVAITKLIPYMKG